MLTGAPDRREPESFTGVDLDQQEANKLRRLNVKLGLTEPMSAAELDELRLMATVAPNRHERRRRRKLMRLKRNERIGSSRT